MLKSKKWLLGATVIGCAIVGLGFLNLGDNLVYFYTPAEAIAKASDIGDKTIRVGAMVKAGSVKRSVEPINVEFVATDLKDAEIFVKYQGIAPDMFKEGQGVVVEGRLLDSGRTMIAKNLLVKHSEEYKKPDAQHSLDKEYLQKSLFKDEK